MADALFDADVIVIGSGVAGAMTAYKLAQKNLKVIVLEAGPRIERGEMLRSFADTWKLDYSGGFPNTTHAPRPDWGDTQNRTITFTGADTTHTEYLRVVGGTTWQWNANCLRFMPSELKMRSTHGVGVDWPIDYKTLEPFYCEAEKEMGVSGDSAAHDGSPRSAPFPLPPIPLTYSDSLIAKALHSTGIKFEHRPVARNSVAFQGRTQCEGFGTCAPLCPSGAQYSAMTHVELAEKVGARIIDNARVDRLVADAAGNIISAEGKRSDGTNFIARGKNFVLAANGIESPRLLLMSASEHYAKGLANSSGLVGRNFMDHPGILCQMRMPAPIFRGRGPRSTMATYHFRNGPDRKTQAGWLMTINNSLRMDDITNRFLEKKLVPPELDAAIRDYAIHEVEFETQMEQLPDERNGFSLNWDERDSAGQPRMQMHYNFGEYEKAGFKNIQIQFDRIAKHMGAQIIQTSKPFGHYHILGMTRMGNGPKSSVVDANCRAHDHKNLFVISSSVFPTGGTANPTLTIAALALRSIQAILK